jgi:drug/metabolite transporter (DMT)-like permease
MNRINHKNAWIFMLLITLCWGSSYVCSKFITNHMDPTQAFTLGGVLGGTIFFLSSWRSLRGFDRKHVGLIVRITLLSILSNVTSLIGIQYTTSTNTAFIIQLSVVMVPLLVSIKRRALPSRPVALSSALALVGLAVLTLDFSNLQTNPGDLLQVAAALFFSLYLIVLSGTNQHLRHQDILAGYYLMSLPIGLILVLLNLRNRPIYVPIDNIGFLAVLLLSTLIILTALSLQIGVSRHMPIELMSISYCLEPVVTAGLAVLLLRESLSLQNLAGMAIILLVLVYINFTSIRQPHQAGQDVDEPDLDLAGLAQNEPDQDPFSQALIDKD